MRAKIFVERLHDHENENYCQAILKGVCDPQKFMYSVVTVLINAHLIKTWSCLYSIFSTSHFLANKIYLLNIGLYVSAYKTITQYICYRPPAVRE